MLRLYIAGFTILAAAILLNILVQKLNIMGWYEFLGRLQEEGKKIFQSMRPADYLWLFAGYPLLLGLSARAGEKLYDMLSKLF